MKPRAAMSIERPEAPSESWATTSATAAIVATIALLLPACSEKPAPAPDAIRFVYSAVDRDGPREPWGKAVGDLNNDGTPDLLVGGQAGGGLVWYENPGWRKHAIGNGSFSTDHEVADIDRDGRNDVVSLTDDGLVWFRGGDFEPLQIATGELHDIEVADLDGDGRVDIAGRGQSAFGDSGDRVVVERQAEASAWTSYAVAVPHGEGLALADVDQDGATDIVVNGIWLRNGGGADADSWSAHSYTSSWTWPHTSIAVHDINGDGSLDIVLAPSELAGTRYRLSWFEAPAARTGEWTEHVIDEDIETVHHAAAVADLDLDGRPDVLTAVMHQGEPPHEVKAYVNLGGDRWRKEVIATTGSHNIRAVDIDADGDVDVFGANWSGERQTVDLWTNQTCSLEQGCPRWRRHVVDAERPGKAVFVHAADLDGDGYVDITAGAWWYRNPGHVGGEWRRQAVGAPANDIVWLYDLDADGDTDALATRWTEERGESGWVFAENDGGRFTPHPLAIAAAGDFLQGRASGAFRSSGGTQLAVSWHVAGKGVQLLSVPANPADAAAWESETISERSLDEALSAGDIDRDGRLDLLLGTAWLRNAADGEWELFPIDVSAGAPDRNLLVDMNSDGRLDAVVGFEAISTPGDLVWYEQGTDVKLPWERHRIATIVGPMSVSAADVDFDADLDIVAGEHDLEHSESARLLIFENLDGLGGSWTEHLVFRGDEHHDGALVADIDRDGDFDLVSVGWGHSRVVWYENLAGRVPFPGR